LLLAVLFAVGFVAACGGGADSGGHPIKPDETITLRHPVTIQGRTVTQVVISPTVRTTQP
jgi:hypothetical protein